ncbi:MAG: helix-turn-helix transcriptional regulator [Erysipelotrichaceae bacterium]|nr:helix-turn-helix transcriptional regulator [Erysipelotrichaceae bacterium]
MFDMNVVAKNIRKARTKKNMTQLNLADEMGVSYQAVSNWERGNSMPDISKIPELCEILEISFEELVGGKSKESEITQKIIKDEEVSLEEISQVAPIVKPEVIEEKAHDSIKKGKKTSFVSLSMMAPFMEEETLNKTALELCDVDFNKLVALAPFLEEETLDILVDQAIENGSIRNMGIIGLLPFLSQKTIQKAYDYFKELDNPAVISSIMPFLDNDDEEYEDILHKVKDRFDQGFDIEDDLNELEDEDIIDLAEKALRENRNLEVFLDYLDSDDIEKLAKTAIKEGYDIKQFLAYLDEDAVKELLLEALKK